MTIRQKLANFIAPTAKNAADVNLAREFLRTGNRRQLMGNWSQLSMSDRDSYTGYMFGALDERANTVVELAEEHLKTSAAPIIMEAAKAKKELVTHPYFPILDASDFQNDDLYYNYSTYIDLEGVHYLVAVRNILRRDDGSVAVLGKIQYFRLVNPYNFFPVYNQTTGELGGYQETQNGLVRDLPIEMVIPTGRLNPFDWNQRFSISDAAKDDQFSLKSARDYTNNALSGNVNAPGIISTGVQLPPEQFENFRARILNHQKGEPLFGNGSGKIDWKSMQTDLEKAALDKINEIGLTGVIATTRVSKTSLGIEQSGVTRESSRVQDERLIGKVGIPLLRKFVGSLNQDYRRYYADEYKRTQYRIFIDNPLKTDREAELKDTEVRQANFDLYTSLVDKGSPADLAAQYAAGEITLAELGEPTEPKPTTTDEPTPPAEQAAAKSAPKQPAPRAICTHTHELPNVVANQSEDDSRSFILQREGVLKAAVVQVQNKLFAAVIDRVTTNAFEEEDDIISKEAKRSAVNELDLALTSFFTVMMPFLGEQAIKRRLEEFAGLEITAYPSYNLDRDARNYIKEAAARASTSHVDTILDDVLEAVRASAAEGVSRDQLVSAIRQTFTEVSAQRADLIATTETYRTFTRSQFDADRQFLDSIGLRAEAKKKWRTRSGNPCAFCQSKANEPAIPFDTPFADLGDIVTAEFKLKDGSTSVRKLPISYETIQSGGLHPRCQCIYELIIETT